jgi:hypothetical protein
MRSTSCISKEKCVALALCKREKKMLSPHCLQKRLVTQRFWYESAENMVLLKLKCVIEK